MELGCGDSISRIKDWQIRSLSVVLRRIAVILASWRNSYGNSMDVFIYP